MKAIRIWAVLASGGLKELDRARPKSEQQIETLLTKSISIISDDLLVIGRQVRTGFGAIDILCMDRYGDIVIIELKRDRTSKDIIAQILEYGSWIKDLSNERINEIANEHLDSKGPLEQAFKEKFDELLPEILNDRHEMLVVASHIDSSTQRIVNYLSEYYGVGINAVTFDYFRDQDGNEFLVRVFTTEPSEIRFIPKKRRRLTYEELEDLAVHNGIGELYQQLLDGLSVYFKERFTTATSVAFIGKIGGRRPTIFHIMPGASDSELGIRFQVYIDKLSEYLNVSTDDISKILPSELEEPEPRKDEPRALAGYFKNLDDVNQFLLGLGELLSHN